jgi:hypothetical protein
MNLTLIDKTGPKRQYSSDAFWEVSHGSKIQKSWSY